MLGTRSTDGGMGMKGGRFLSTLSVNIVRWGRRNGLKCCSSEYGYGNIQHTQLVYAKHQQLKYMESVMARYPTGQIQLQIMDMEHLEPVAPFG